ncbi:MAG: tryptophan-rich sensory protein [Rhodocyclaceae bacterium]|nr:tryptophan-rich sensory protein [Rhodocyclaceae bacterium]
MSLRQQSLVAASITLASAAAGGALTPLDDWYYGLQQPWFKPPDWVFGPAWTLIFTLTAVAGVLCWRATREPAAQRLVLGLFLANAALNVLWSFLFFWSRRPDWALTEVGVLWSSVALLVFAGSRLDWRAGALLVPYLAWVSLASLINQQVVALNAPFH